MQLYHRSLTRHSRNQTGLKVRQRRSTLNLFRKIGKRRVRKAPEERKNVAHGVSHGIRRKSGEPRDGAKECRSFWSEPLF